MQDRTHADALLRLAHIIGGPSSDPIIPIGKSGWWVGCADGRFPTGIKIGRITAWPAREITALAQALVAGASDDELRALTKALMEARLDPGVMTDAEARNLVRRHVGACRALTIGEETRR
jgi:prophage regulatory protein